MIISKQNQYVKLVRELRTKKGRDEHRKLVVEGKKAVADCLKMGVKCDYLLFDDSQSQFAENQSAEAFEVSKEIMKEISSQVTPQGILGVFECPQFYTTKPTTDVMILDGLQDAGNVGTILRTALATDFKRVVLIDCVDVFSDKVVNATMTAVFNLELCKCKRNQAVEMLKEWNIPLYIADLDGVNALQFKPQCGIIGLVIGNEGNGVSREIKSCATEVITLPMEQNIESLNASVSAGVLMYILKMNRE